MEHFELRVLADYTHTGVQVANTWARPTPRAVGGELERDERAEVVFAEIVSPFLAPATEEALLRVIPVLDGKTYEDYVSLSGIRATVMAPPKSQVLTNLYSFGTPMSKNPITSTTLKYKESITVNCLAGATNITQDYRVRLWGYVYKTAELARVFETMLFPATFRDGPRNRSLFISKAPIVVNGDTWATLPGGKDQAVPKINPFIRYAYNVNATDGMQGDRQLRYDTGEVLTSEENMLFDFGAKDAVLIEGLGIKAAVNLAYTSLLIGGNYHPKGKIPTTIGNNPLNFGHGYPFWDTDIPIYFAIPKLEKPYLIWNEIGSVVINDDGVGTVAARAICAAISGIRIEMTGA